MVQSQFSIDNTISFNCFKMINVFFSGKLFSCSLNVSISKLGSLIFISFSEIFTIDIKVSLLIGLPCINLLVD